MKLRTIQVFPGGMSGWGTGVLKFGSNITQLFGVNGCGKTPIIQSIAFCLGYPSVFRNDIYEHCSHVILHLEINRNVYSIKRVYSRDVDIEVTLPDSSKERFYSEGEFSCFIFENLDIPTSNLVGTSNKVVQPYLATLLPLFYAEQDKGYTEIYVSPNTFIKDQFSEMMRMVFNLPGKNLFDAKKGRILAKQKLDNLDILVNDKVRELDSLKEVISSYSLSSDEFESEINRLESELESLKGVGSARDDSVLSLDRLISGNRQRLHQLEFDLKDIRKRRKGISTITSEINSEINALNLNEEAKRVFLSFNEVCSSVNCQLFSGSSDAYAKNLLYLKDQLKDLQRNDGLDKRNEEGMENEISTLTEVIKKTVDERNQLVKKSDVESIVTAVSEVMSEIFRLQLQLSEVDKVEQIEKKYVSVLNKRSKALEEYESYKGISSSNPDIVRLRANLRSSFLWWIDKLHTRNVSRDVTFKNDFMPVLGRETISQLGGSTKVRAVLAFHASLFELAAHSGSEFDYLILDTPKQHEIHNDDLDIYFKALKVLCEERDLQVIFSTTEYKYEGDSSDTTWVPEYPGEEQLMFMKMSNK